MLLGYVTAETVMPNKANNLGRTRWCSATACARIKLAQSTHTFVTQSWACCSHVFEVRHNPV